MAQVDFDPMWPGQSIALVRLSAAVSGYRASACFPSPVKPLVLSEFETTATVAIEQQICNGSEW